jgi:hypothetical protein
MDAQLSNEFAEYQANLRSLIYEIAAKSGVPSIGVEISAGGVRIGAAVGVLTAGGNARIGSESRFGIGVVTNMLVSLAILDLITSRLVDIGAPIENYLPELRASRFGSEISLAHLLSHSGGYQSFTFEDSKVRENYSMDNLISFLREARFLFTPGTVFSYTPTATAVMSAIISRIADVTADEFIRARFLDPLKIGTGRDDSEAESCTSIVGCHRLDLETRQFIPTAPLRWSELWRSVLCDYKLSLSDLVTLFDGIANARDDDGSADCAIHPCAAKTIQRQVVPIPFTTGTGATGCLPMSFGLGCARFLPDWYGCSGAFAGQSTSVRYHSKQNVVAAVGLSAHLPGLQDSILNNVLQSIMGDVEPPEIARDDNPPSVYELNGSYMGSIDSTVEIMVRDRRTIAVQGQTSRKELFTALMKLDEYNRWVVSTAGCPKPLGVFRDPTSWVPTLMVGVVAHKKMDALARAPS